MRCKDGFVSILIVWDSMDDIGNVYFCEVCVFVNVCQKTSSLCVVGTICTDGGVIYEFWRVVSCVEFGFLYELVCVLVRGPGVLLICF